MDLKLIAKSELFRGIDEVSIEKMLHCSNSRIKEYSADEVIFSEDEISDYLYVLLKGEVMIIKDYPSGNRNVFYEVEDGEIFGDLFHGLDNSLNYYDAISAKKSKVMIIPWNFFFNVCEKACDFHKMLIKNIMQLQSDKALTLMKKIHILSATTLEEKIALYLIQSMKDDKRVTLNMTREEMADYFGVKRPSLSRSLMKMQKDKLIKVDKKYIMVLEEEKLQDLCF